jgi:hypothetical protein
MGASTALSSPGKLGTPNKTKVLVVEIKKTGKLGKPYIAFGYYALDVLPGKFPVCVKPATPDGLTLTTEREFRCVLSTFCRNHRGLPVFVS